MDFDLDDQQRLLKQTARNFMEKEIIPVADEYDRIRPFPKELAVELLRKLAPLGYIDGLVPVEWGGQGLSHLSWGILLEELARAWGGLSFISLVQGGIPYVIARTGTDEQRRKFIPPALSLDKLCCLALTEPDYGSNAVDIQTSAVLSGDHYVVNGTKTWITNGTFADLCLLVAVTDRSKGPAGLSTFIVDKEVSPFAARELAKMGLHASPAAELTFEDCRVPRENLLGEPGTGYKRTLTAFEFFRSGVSSCALGLAQAALDAAIGYARERQQFGRPIGTFQMIQEMIVDMVTETEAARFLLYRAWQGLDRGGRGAGEAALAKAFVTSVAERVASKALQIHGAYGLSEEFPVERYFRDARCMSIPDGTTQVMKLIAGREILGLSAIT